MNYTVIHAGLFFVIIDLTMLEMETIPVYAILEAANAASYIDKI